MSQQSAVTTASERLRDPDAELNPKRLERWFEDLPVLNPAVSVGAVRSAVADLNTAELPARRRFDLLHLYRKHAVAVFQAFSSVSFQKALDEEMKPRVTEDVGGLFAELGQGYNILVIEGEEDPAPWGPDTPWAEALLGAMEQAIYGLLHAFRTYGPLTPNLHGDLNRLYRLAEDRDVLRVPLRSGRSRKRTAGGLYKQISLLAISDPFHYPNGEVVNVFEVMSRYTTSCRIGRQVPDSPPERLFCVDLAGNTPPVPLSRVASPAALRDPRIIDLDPVIKALTRDQLTDATSPRGRVRAEQAKQLTSHLLPRLTAPGGGRREPRIRTQRLVRATIGLESILYFISDDARRLREALTDPSDTLQMRTVGAGDTAGHDLSTWMVCDESRSGYRLRQPGLGRVEASAGEPVGLVDETGDGPPRTEIGLIVWARHDEAGRLQLGVRRLASEAAAARIPPGDGAAGEPDGVPCIHMTGIEADVPALLLTGKGVLREGSAVTLGLEGDTRQITLVRRRAEIATLDCFTVEPLLD